MRELDRLDRVHGLGASPLSPPAGRRQRPRRTRSSGPIVPSLLVAIMVVVGVVALSPDESFRAVRRLAGFGDDRLGAAPQVPRGLGTYRFLTTQHGEPVGYDPCRPVEVLVNPEHAPPGYDRLVDTALAHTAAATGLRFDRVGFTEDRDVSVSGFGGGRPRPVLVMWADAGEVGELAGEVAGIGGSAAVEDATGRLRYVTGRVVLDATTFAGFTAAEQPLAQAIVDHELGHLVGLAHVDDPNELMNADNVGRTTYGPGDREGLSRLGSIRC